MPDCSQLFSPVTTQSAGSQLPSVTPKASDMTESPIFIPKEITPKGPLTDDEIFPAFVPRYLFKFEFIYLTSSYGLTKMGLFIEKSFNYVLFRQSLSTKSSKKDVGEALLLNVISLLYNVHKETSSFNKSKT